MAHKVNDLKFKMRISSLKVLSFSQVEIEIFNIDKQGAIEYQSDFKIHILKELAEIGIETNVKLKAKELNKYFAELKIMMGFSISPFDTIIKKVDNNYQIPDIILSNLFNIVVGTMRGVLFERLKGTAFQNEVLPLIAVQDLIKNTKVSST